MPAGRPPKPSRLRELEGNRGRRPVTKSIELPSRPMPPSYLDEQQLTLWHQIERATPAGVLTLADNQTIERMVVAWSRYRECQHKIGQLSLFMRGSQGQLVMSPLVRIQHLAAREMHLAGEALGLSPVARARISAPENIDNDPLTLLLDGQVYRPAVPVPKGPKIN